MMVVRHGLVYSDLSSVQFLGGNMQLPAILVKHTIEKKFIGFVSTVF
jgi:hypothetical protein